MHASHTVLGRLVWNHKTRPANADARVLKTNAQIKVEEGRGVMQVMRACVRVCTSLTCSPVCKVDDNLALRCRFCIRTTVSYRER